MNTIKFIFTGLLITAFACSSTVERFTSYVNPFLGTTTLWDSIDLGYTPTRRTWGAEVFPGASLPNAMVQVSPVTLFRSGSGYQYEDTVIYAFTHTNKGHWNLCHVPILPVTGNLSPDTYCSGYSHSRESAQPGYYQVFLERYKINAEVTSTLRCAYHKYTYENEKDKKIMLDLSISNENVRSWDIVKESENAFSGYQQTGEKIYFHAVANHTIRSIDSLSNGTKKITIVDFDEASGPLELKIGFSFVSAAKAKENLEKEMIRKSFAQVRKEAVETWESLLSKIKVTGGSEKQKGLFYSCLYRSFLWPALRSDADQEYTDATGMAVNNGFHYYTDPSFWDDYRNKLVLLGMLSPEIAVDVINSITDKGLKRGFMPTFFHGDHASVFVAGSYLRGLRGFDVDSAYSLIVKNATVPTPGRRGPRPYLAEYIEKGYIAEEAIQNPDIPTIAKAAVTKTLEYAYDDYAVAQMAKALNKHADYELLMKRTGNYKKVFDPSTGFMRGRLEDGSWVEPFDPYFPFYEYLYREANAWQSTFFAPHDPQGLIELYGSNEAFENKLDSMFAIPWKGYEAHNLSGFIGQYCHGNQPDHSTPYMYYFIDKQEKAQELLDSCMNRFYGMGKEGLAYAGMDDAGEMSSWYVFNAIGLYTFSPADPVYLVTVPIFDKVVFSLDAADFTIVKKNKGKKITGISYGGQKQTGYFIAHSELKKGKELVITTE
jgi:predicted alpha-1,2-mannosidase